MSREEPTPSESEEATASVPADEATAPVVEMITPDPRRVVIEPMTPSRSFWTRIDKPFVFGFLVTLGGLAAIVLGIAVTSL